VNTASKELKELKEGLPGSVKIKRIDEKLSALGNCIICNDYVALPHQALKKKRKK